MSSVNKVILIGHLGRDPEIRSTQNGMRIGTLSVATSESWRDKVSGDRKEKTEWHRVSVMNESLVTVTEKYLRKGSQVYLEGQLQTRQWQDKDGATRYTTEIVLSKFRGILVMLGGGKDDSRDEAEEAPQARAPQQALSAELDDEIPF